MGEGVVLHHPLPTHACEPAGLLLPTRPFDDYFTIRFEIHLYPAEACGQAWYCSTACRDTHASQPLAAAVSSRTLPHGALCPVLKHFGQFKMDAEGESVFRAVLDAVALRHLETLREAAEPENGSTRALEFENGKPIGCCLRSAAESAAEATGNAIDLQRPKIDRSAGDEEPASSCCSSCASAAASRSYSHADFLRLESHAVSYCEEDLRDWSKGARFLIKVCPPKTFSTGSFP